MKALLTPLSLLAMTLALASCIKDDVPPCQALSLTLAVHDKNYANIDRVPEEHRLSDTLDLRQYVRTWRWTLRDATTGQIVEEQPYDTVWRQGRELDLTFCECVPFGRYVFTAYGNLIDASQADDTTGVVTLHPNHRDDGDVFLSNDTLLYDPAHTHYRSELFRTKDELIVEIVNLPAQTYTATLTATHLFAEADPRVDPDPKGSDDFRFLYTGETQVSHTEQLALSDTMKIYLAPTSNTEKAVLHLTLRFTNQATLEPKDVTIPLKRNYISVIRYEYDPDAPGQFVIKAYMDGAWETLSQLELD